MKKKLYIVLALLLTAVISGGAFAYTAMTKAQTITVTSATDLATVTTTGSPSWIAVGETIVNIGAEDLYTITTSDNVTTVPDLRVHVYLTNAAELVPNYDYINMELDITTTGTMSAVDWQLLTLQNGVAIFDITGMGKSEVLTVELIGGSYYCTDPSGAGNPVLYAEVKQAGQVTE